jgi:hypothetical protein
LGKEAHHVSFRQNDDFAAKPGAPNAFGLVGGEANAPHFTRRTELPNLGR